MFDVKEDIFDRNYSPGAKWTLGVIEKQSVLVLLLVKLADGHLRRCHRD